MPHSWNARPDRNVPHVVECSLCGVVVERTFDENGRGVNYYAYPGGEPARGMAPACHGAPLTTMPATATVEDAIAPRMIRPRPIVQRPRPTPAERPAAQRAATRKAPAAETTPPLDVKLAPKAHRVFMELAESASSWAGWTLTDGTVRTSPSERNLLSHLRKAGLILVRRERVAKQTLITFTELGIDYAHHNGVDLSWIKYVQPIGQYPRN